MTCSLQKPENACQRRVNNISLCIKGNLVSDWLQTSIYQRLAAFRGINRSHMLLAIIWQWASIERQRCLDSYLGWLIFRLVVDIQLPDIGSPWRLKQQLHVPWHIMRMSISGVSMIFSFASWVIYLPICCWPPLISNWQPLQKWTTATCSLLHPANMGQRRADDIHHRISCNLCSDWLLTSSSQILVAFEGIINSEMVAATSWQWTSTEHQWSFNSFICCIFGNEDIARMFALIKELSNALIENNIICQRWNTDSKFIDIASCKVSKNISLVVEKTILIRYY